MEWDKGLTAFGKVQGGRGGCQLYLHYYEVFCM